MNLQDTEALAIHWTKAQPVVSAYISSLIPDFHQAEDVLHQVAVVLVRKFHEYEHSQSFVAWALGIARLEVLKHRRHYSTDKHQFGDDLVDLVGAAYEELADELDDRRQALRECLKALQGRSLEVLRLRYFEGLKPQAAASRLGMAGGAVRVLLSRVRSALRMCIQRRLTAPRGAS